MGAFDGYFGWLSKGGIGRITVGLVLPVVLVIAAASALIDTGGEKGSTQTLDSLVELATTAPPTSPTTIVPAAAQATAVQPTSTAAPPPPTATSAPVVVPPTPTTAIQPLVALPTSTSVPPPAPTLLPTATTAPPPAPTATRVTAPGNSQYLPGNAYNCGDFANYAQAKAYFDAVPGDPSRLDADEDGIPCESLPGAP